MPDNTFDIVSKIDLAEVNNALQQAMKEIQQRYDLKNSKSNIELIEKDHKIILSSEDEFKLKAVTEVFELKLIKRKVSAQGLGVRSHRSRGWIFGPAGSHSAAGHPHRKGPRHRQIDQGQQEKGAGLYQCRLGARVRDATAMHSRK